MADLNDEIDSKKVRSGLCAIITARLEDAHMFAVKGQSKDLDAAEVSDQTTNIRSILDEVAIQLDAAQLID